MSTEMQFFTLVYGALCCKHFYMYLKGWSVVDTALGKTGQTVLLYFYI